MATPITYRIDGEPTTLRLEPVFSTALRDIATREGTTPAGVIASAEAAGNGNRTSAVRCHALTYYRTALEACEAAQVRS